MFFDWLVRITSVVRVDGQGDAILIHISSRRISENNLRELLALFRRYKVRMAQLAQFESDLNRRWFRDPNAAWYHLVFKS